MNLCILIIENQSNGTQPNWTTLTTTDLALAGPTKPNLYNQTIGAYFVAGGGFIFRTVWHWWSK